MLRYPIRFFVLGTTRSSCPHYRVSPDGTLPGPRRPARCSRCPHRRCRLIADVVIVVVAIDVVVVGILARPFVWLLKLFCRLDLARMQRLELH